jgi:hypothetical protein
LTEGEVVDFSGVSLIEILSNDQLENSFRRGHNVQLFKNSSKLLVSDMATL